MFCDHSGPLTKPTGPSAERAVRMKKLRKLDKLCPQCTENVLPYMCVGGEYRCQCLCGQAGGAAYCPLHGPADMTEEAVSGETAVVPANDHNTCCKACTKANADKKRNTRKRQRHEKENWNDSELDCFKRMRAPVPSLHKGNTMRKPIAFKDYCCERLRFLEYYFLKWGAVDSKHVYNGMSKKEAAELWEKRFVVLAHKPTIGGDHNSARVLFVEEGRRPEPALMVRRLFDAIAAEYSELLDEFGVQVGESSLRVDWPSVTGNRE
eukprot:g6363.t1